MHSRGFLVFLAIAVLLLASGGGAWADSSPVFSVSVEPRAFPNETTTITTSLSNATLQGMTITLYNPDGSVFDTITNASLGETEYVFADADVGETFRIEASAMLTSGGTIAEETYTTVRGFELGWNCEGVGESDRGSIGNIETDIGPNGKEYIVFKKEEVQYNPSLQICEGGAGNWSCSCLGGYLCSFGGPAGPSYISDLKVDSENNLHIVGRTGFYGGARYCKYNKKYEYYGYTGSCEDLSGSGEMGLFIDSDGTAYYNHVGSGGLEICSGSMGNWNCYTADAGSSVSTTPSIAKTGHDPISVYNKIVGSFYDVELRICSGAYCYTGDSGFSNISYNDRPDLAEKSTWSAAHISYIGGGGELKYCKGSCQTIESGNSGSNSSISIDDDGKAHIAYYGGAEGELRYCTNKSGSWECEQAGASTYVNSQKDSRGREPSLFIDEDGLVHIAHSKTNPIWSNSTQLRYCYQQPVYFEVIMTLGWE